MECSFGISASFVLPETQKILAQCPKVRKVPFLPEFSPKGCSTGRVQCLTDEPGVFFQIRFSSEKPSKDIKLYLPPNEVLPKKSSGHVDFVLDTLVENFCNKSGISSLKIRKECQTYIFFGEKTRLSQIFSLDIWNAVLTTPSKMFRQETGTFSLIAQKSKRFGFCKKIFPRSAPLRCTRRKPSWFVQFFFEVFADAKFADSKPLANFFSKNIEVFR